MYCFATETKKTAKQQRSLQTSNFASITARILHNKGAFVLGKKFVSIKH